MLPSSKYLLTHLQYVRSPPSIHYAQAFQSRGHPSAGVHPHSRHQRRHSDPRYHSGTHPTHYAHDHRHRFVQSAPPPFAVQTQMPVQAQMHYHSQPQARRSSTGDGPRIADFNINPQMAYPSYSHSEPRHIHTKSILRNRGGPPSAHVVSDYARLDGVNTRGRTNANSPAHPTSRESILVWRFVAAASGSNQTSSIPAESSRTHLSTLGSRDHGS